MPVMAKFPAVIGAVMGAGMAILAVADGAVAQQPGDWQGVINRINRLQEQMYDLRDGQARGVTQLQGAEASTDSASEAGLALRISSVEEQMRNLTGQIEQLAYQVQQLSDRFNRFSEDVEFRFRDLGPGKGQSGSLNVPSKSQRVATARPQRQVLNDGSSSSYLSGAQLPDNTGSAGTGSHELNKAPGPGLLGTIPANGLQTSSLVPGKVTSQPLDGPGSAGGPDGLYQESHEQLLRRQFDAAEAGFKKFLRMYPKDKLAANAQYWLGESYYARQQYELAAKAFLEGYKKHSKGAKAPDNLVKLGMTLAQLGQKKQACAALAEAQKRFPKATAVRQVASSERSRVGC